jgi:hypothetical protein
MTPPEESLNNETPNVLTTTITTTTHTEVDDRKTQEFISKTVDYTPYYLVTFGIIVAGALIAIAIYRKK